MRHGEKRSAAAGASASTDAQQEHFRGVWGAYFCYRTLLVNMHTKKTLTAVFGTERRGLMV